VTVTRFRSRIGKGAAQGSGVYGSAVADMQRISQEFNSFVGHMRNMGPEILHAALVPTFKKSQDYCPVDTGDLINSGYLEIIGRGRSPTVAMGYGRGGYPSYAPIVHEDTTMSHKSPTRAKWLEAALQEDYQAVIKRVNDLTAFAGGFR